MTFHDGDDLIGYVELDGIIWPHSVCGFSVAIGDRANWGKGYGYEAARLALAFAFDELNLHRVTATVFSNNERSIALVVVATSVASSASRTTEDVSAGHTAQIRSSAKPAAQVIRPQPRPRGALYSDTTRGQRRANCHSAGAAPASGRNATRMDRGRRDSRRVSGVSSASTVPPTARASCRAYWGSRRNW
ncbi:MAG: GNAT family N-acetyltransferase [Anaerolineae bacterium]|nr:GNAT family N-acetyltransferase [Anaerolineae bacterium]